LNWQWDYTGYEDRGGFMFPGRLHHHAGDIRNGPHHGISIDVARVEANVDVPLLAVPDAVRAAAIAPVEVESEEIADGVWRIAGGSHHSIAVELEDSYIMIEAPLNEERSIAVIQEAQRVIPNKRLTHLVVTHHHFDHSSGMRTYVVHGAELVTHESSRDFYNELVLYPYPRLMQPDLLSTYYPRMAPDKLPVFHTVGSENLVIGDATRSVEFHSLEGLDHAEDMLIVYVPDEGILINADLYSPPEGGGPGAPNASARTLADNIERLGLDVDRHVGIHGGVGSHEDFLEAMGN
jgi:glyoxylase-like metal-dependent hydrolase (beta-lactamase superfamily II)